jgi:hypothetical protein
MPTIETRPASLIPAEHTFTFAYDEVVAALVDYASRTRELPEGSISVHGLEYKSWMAARGGMGYEVRLVIKERE